MTNFGKSSENSEAIHHELIGKARILGRKYGKSNLPKPEDKNLDSYIAPIVSGYSQMLAPYMKPRSSTILESLKADAASEKKKHLQGKLEMNTAKLRQIEMELDEMPIEEKEPKALTALGVHIFVLCIALIEAAITRRAVTIFEGGNNLAQIGIFITLTIVFFGAPEGTAFVYRSLEGNKYRTHICIGLGIIISAAFWCLSYMRTMFLNNASMTTLSAGTSQSVSVSPFLFFTLQIFLFTLSIAVTSMLPSAEDRRRVRNRSNAQAKAENLERSIKRLEDELHAMPSALVNDEQAKVDHQEHSSAMVESITSSYQEAAGIFKEELMLWRTDGLRPAALDAPIPLLTIKQPVI